VANILENPKFYQFLKSIVSFSLDCVGVINSTMRMFMTGEIFLASEFSLIPPEMISSTEKLACGVWGVGGGMWSIAAVKMLQNQLEGIY
jgi:hypothetical protein